MVIKRDPRAIGNAQVSLNRLIAYSKAYQEVGAQDVRDALEFGAKKAEKEAIAYASANLRGSGIQRRKGNLARDIKESILRIVETNGRFALLFSAAPGKEKSYYKKMNSLNYGAVRTPGENDQMIKYIGAKRKRTLKKNVRNEAKMSKLTKYKSLEAAKGVYVSEGSLKKTEAGSVEGKTSIGQIAVTKSFNFFQLKPTQQTKVSATVFGNAVKFIDKLISNKVR